MATLDSFLPWVLPAVPGCSEPQALQAVRDAAIDFCARTDLVQRVQTIDCTATSQDYTITPPTDMSTARVLSVWWQGVKLQAAPPEIVEADVVLRGAPIGVATPQSGSPAWFFQKTQSGPGFSVYPIPDTTLTGGFTAKVSFTPSNTATTVEDLLYNDWVAAIASGAKALLMAMPGTAFSSQKSAAVYASEYEKAVVAGRRQAIFGQLPSALRVQPVAFR